MLRVSIGVFGLRKVGKAWLEEEPVLFQHGHNFELFMNDYSDRNNSAGILLFKKSERLGHS